MRYLPSITAYSLVVIAALGCGGGPAGPTLYPVTGTVKSGGKPLAGVSVALIHTDEKKAITLSGNTKSDGTFEILTGQGKKGAPEGNYKVILSPSRGGSPDDMKAKYTKTKQDPGKSQDAEIPKELQSLSTTTKTFEVKKTGSNTLSIDL